jgi:hypothetical protein
MGRKGKTQKHTAKEIAAKTKAAKERNGAAGGGGSALAGRMNKMKLGNVTCEVCKAAQPNIKSMTAHWDSKHSKMTFPAAQYEAQYDAIKAAKRAEQKNKGKSAAGTGKKVNKKGKK